MATTSPWADDGEYALTASTRWRTARSLHNHTLLACMAQTGRRHQIRIHLADCGLPIVGDALYGGPPPAMPIAGHFLHARAIVFPHPRSDRTERTLRVCAPLSPDRQALLRSLMQS